MDSAAALAPIVEKNLLNSFVSSFMSLKYTGHDLSLAGIQSRIEPSIWHAPIVTYVFLNVLSLILK